MALDPVTFQDGSAQLRHYPLAALPLVREYGRLLKRLDQGAIDTLSYLTADERSALLTDNGSFDLSRALVLLRVLADLVGEQELDTIVCEYLQVGRVEILAGSAWVPLADHPDASDDPTTPLLAAWTVIGGLLRPLGARLRRLSAQGAARISGQSTANIAPAVSEPTPPT
jgi:hypothetical protein